MGAAHYMGSTKALAEEGIDPRVRLRAIPMAVSFTLQIVPKYFMHGCSRPSVLHKHVEYSVMRPVV